MSENTDPGLTPEASPVICPNCATTITGPFCAKCGQAQKNFNRYLWTMVAEVFDDVFRLDSRAARTFFNLLFKPGQVTTEYFSGRRARYVPPIRLYLVISFLFFVLLPFLGQPVPRSEVVDVPAGDSATSEQTEEQSTDWQQEIAKIDSLDLGFLTPEENAALAEVLKEQINKAITLYHDYPEEMFSEFMDLLSVGMFFLLPIFAICLKILYLRKGRYYAEHLLLAVHNHCFLFVALLASGLLNLAQGTSFALVANYADTIIQLWILIYLYLSLKNTYQEGHLATTIKFIVLGFSYGALALFGTLVAILVGVMTL